MTRGFLALSPSMPMGSPSALSPSITMGSTSEDEAPPSARFLTFSTATCPTPLQTGQIMLLLVQARTKSLTSHGELAARKRYVRMPLSWLRRNERLSGLLPSAVDGEPLHVPLADEALGVEAVAQALEMHSVPKREQRQLLEHTQWQPLCALLQAAAWLGSTSLVAVCEMKLCEHVRLDNVVALARAAERCSALKLLTGCFCELLATGIRELVGVGPWSFLLLLLLLLLL